MEFIAKTVIILSLLLGSCHISTIAQQRRAQTSSTNPQLLTVQESKSAIQRLKYTYTIVDQCGDYNLFMVSGRTNSGIIIHALVDKYGKEIIPSSRGYEAMYYEKEAGYEYIKVRQNSSVGVCRLDGKELISPSAKVSFVRFSEEDGYIGYFYVEKWNSSGSDYAGAYDIYGKEIISPILYTKILFDEGRFWSKEGEEWVPLIYGLDRNGRGIRVK